jgi:hypothetical protein
MKRWSRVLLIFVMAAAHAETDPRVSFLEQEVRNLHRQVDQLSRQVDRLTTRPDRPKAPGSPASAPRAAADSTQWVDAGLWKKIRPGMSELEVIGTLGPPTSMREEAGARLLLYALEIGSSGFLGGSVVLRDRTVIEVRQPTLQ